MNSALLLQQLLQQAPDNSLWCLGENSAETLPVSMKLTSLCNRYDLSQEIEHCIFSDFDFSLLAEKRFEHIIFRLEKEKAINLHIAHQGLQQLSDNGTLHIIGYKNEGIESLAKMLTKNTNASIKKTKYKQLHHLELSKATDVAFENNYDQLQELSINGFDFISKPGVFGWQKIDLGSQLLMQELAQHNLAQAQASLLDLGCGYGYLSLQAKQLGFKHIDATDNNAAALLACQANFVKNAIDGKVIADHIGQSLAHASYDIVLCNPPFHQGFAHSKQLIQDFCTQAHRVLKTKGEAWFVVNQFIGIEPIAEKLFSQVERLKETQGFRLYRCRK